ncbi:MAG TPA: hypothetical protein PKA16_03225 [Ottowia sp.]|uniref:hypothetical protein n=1 Tax=Ottowia sp. TaxID=1898956 RepID=UPI002D043AD0|nr:hypothetical protein [Ottowia sp.]HMN20384.1 hypothetical protein [Ottowia sp.]
MKYRNGRLLPHALAIGTMLALAACGGSGGDGAEAPPPAKAAVHGTVATGEALANAKVRVTDRTGVAACTEDPLQADLTGAFTCELKPGASAPLILVATDPAGLRDPLVSLATALPGAGQDATVNISPLTTAMVAQIAPNKDPFALAADSAALAAVDPDALAAVRANVNKQLADVLPALGLDPATFDPISTPFVGGSNTGGDGLLDQVRVTFENGAPVLSNVLNPDADPVPMAGISEAPPVPPATVIDFSATELDILQTAFERCFAVPSTVRDSNADCDDILVDDADPALTGGAAYLNSGFDGAQSFGTLIASADMDGAKFNRPELMLYVPKSNGDEAVVNLRFTDKNGVGDNRILIAKKFAGSATAERNSNWWLYGNQRTVNAYVRASIRKQEQFLPEEFRAQYDIGPSRFQTGLEIYVARSGARGQSLANLRYVRIKGPGLPTAGLVLADPGGLPQDWMAIHNADGVIPADRQYSTGSSNIFYLQRSMDITGPDAYKLRSMPWSGNAAPVYNNWAHPVMYGEAPDPEWQFDLGKAPAWSTYHFELFTAADDDPNTPTTPTPAMTFSTAIVTPVVPAAYAATQQWHEQPASTRALVTNGAPAASSLTLEWLINPYAQRVDSVNVYTYDSDGDKTVNSASIRVPKGASSQEAAAGGGTFPALTTSHLVSRSLQWRYKMLDGSYKDQVLTFN